MNTLNLQRALIRLGFDPGYPDGVMGPQTQRAWSAFLVSLRPATDQTPDDDKVADALAALPAPAPFIIDVSVAQTPGSIDLVCAKMCGCIGLIARAEYGTHVDGTYHPWLDAADAVGLRKGVYAFAMVDNDPDNEVAVLTKELGGRKLDYGVSLDVETRNGASPGNIVTWCSGYISETEQARGEPFGMLYTGPGFWNGLGVVAQDVLWTSRKLWVANYGVATPMRTLPWPAWGQTGGPVLHQRWGNTIWSNPSSKEQKWGKASPGPGWVRIAAPYFSPWSRAEVDCSQLPPGATDDSALLVGAT